MKRKRDLLSEIQAREERSEFNLAAVKLLSLALSFDRRPEPAYAVNCENGLYVIGIIACVEDLARLQPVVGGDGVDQAVAVGLRTKNAVRRVALQNNY